MTEPTEAIVVAEPIAERMRWRDRLARAMGGDVWTIGLAVVFVALFVFTLLLRPLRCGADDLVEELPAARADEPTLLRAAHGLPIDAGDAA